MNPNEAQCTTSPTRQPFKESIRQQLKDSIKKTSRLQETLDLLENDSIFEENLQKLQDTLGYF